MNRDSFRLAGNDRLPAVGLGLWKVERPLAAQTAQEAIAAGYRHFDCACDYGNESEVGEGLARALQSGAVRRDELWITSKLWNTYHAAEYVRPAVERSLADLRLEYLDLYLIHFPLAHKFVPFNKRYPPGWFHDPDSPQPRVELAAVPIAETWQAMENLVRGGLVRNIGVCNFNTALLRDLLTCAEILPAVLQVEMHPFLAQEKLLRFCMEHNIVVTAFSPLGAASYVSLGMAEADDSALEQPAVCEAAKRHVKTAAQVLLRWGVQRGTAVIPKTTRPERLRENLAIFDFELSDEEMKAITALDRNRRFNDPGVFGEKA
ncbi:MAG TPA: aldo/keto reductase, partial [Lacipirellulaceae bacterium]|nr:aldo/keto reductase [Lacipirellulaceae bacterium]